MKKANLIGMIFGSLTVISQGPHKVYKGKNRAVQWLCKCVCGNEVLVHTGLLLRKDHPRISCGCKNFTGEHANRTSEDPKLVSYRAKIKAYRATVRHRKIGIIDWALTEEQAISLFQGDCFYCGIGPTNSYNVYITKAGKPISKALDWCRSAEIKYNGIDRKNSSLGYTIDNVVSCCKNCNYAKNTMSLDEFYEWIDRLIKYRGYSK